MAGRNAATRQMAVAKGAKYDSSKAVEPVVFLDDAGNPVDPLNAGPSVNRVYASPVHGQTVASTTPASLPTPWAAVITTRENSDVDYDLNAKLRCASGQPTFYAYLYRDGLLIDQGVYGGSFGVNGMTIPIQFSGTDQQLSAGEHTYEVKIRSYGGETIYVVNVGNAAAAYNDPQGYSTLRVTEVLV